MADTARQIADNLARVQQQVAHAAQRSGRSPADIRLVAVTKYVDSQIARCLYQAGCRDLGESRPQELWAKAEALADLEVRWHLIGHLQRNKIHRSLPCTSLLQSVDSLRLLQAIDAWAEAHQQRLSLLLEVNVSGETAKHGFAPDTVPEAVRQAASSPWTHVDGLMCMASLTGGLERARGLRTTTPTARCVPPTMARRSPAHRIVDGYECRLSRGYRRRGDDRPRRFRTVRGSARLIALQPHPAGVVMAVRAQPGARRTEIRGLHGGALKIGVTQIAEKGKANRALRDFLAEALQVNRSQVELLSGETSSQKKFLIHGRTLDELRERVLALLPNDSWDNEHGSHR